LNNPVNLIPCACGCGQYRSDRDRRGRERKYIHDHRFAASCATARKYLRPQEVSAEIASSLDFNSQCVIRTHVRIARTCISCAKRQFISVGELRRGRSHSKCFSCERKTRTGINAPIWKGGRWTDGQGYVHALSPTHPYSNQGYVLEHRLVMERMIGRYLKPYETVHHKNGNRQDNRPENLELRTGHHGSGVRISDLKHCRTCRCARKMKAIPLLTLDFFISAATAVAPPSISTGTYLTNDRKEPDPIIY
jgi:hypothetical protein